MFRKLGHVLMILAVLAATGTHWAVLQSVAWTTMIAQNLQTTSLEHAVALTFDGKHPCCLCRQIARGKQSEKKSDIQVELKKLEYSYIKSEFVFCPPAAFYETQKASGTPSRRASAPPVPPPKELLG